MRKVLIVVIILIVASAIYIMNNRSDSELINGQSQTTEANGDALAPDQEADQALTEAADAAANTHSDAADAASDVSGHASDAPEEHGDAEGGGQGE